MSKVEIALYGLGFLFAFLCGMMLAIVTVI